MKRLIGPLLVLAWLSNVVPASLGDEKDATPILDKAIAALGGEAKLAKAATHSSKGTGTITFGENESSIKTSSIVDGIDRQRSEVELEFNGMPVKGLTIVNGDKGWRKFGEDSQPLEGDMLVGTKQAVYLQLIGTTILPLKSKPFKTEAGADEKVGEKSAAVVKATGPDGKPFTLYFDKETGLPIKLTAMVSGFQGDEVKQDTIYADYKEFEGVKRATKVESKRDGNPFLKVEYSEFKLIDKPAASTFSEPL